MPSNDGIGHSDEQAEMAGGMLARSLDEGGAQEFGVAGLRRVFMPAK